MKTFIIFLLLVHKLFASDINPIQVKVLEKIISELSMKEPLKLWSDNKQMREALHKNNILPIVENWEESTMIIVEDKNNLPASCNSKYIFVLDYKLLKELPHSFGALFWKKGRPNIVLIEPRLENQSIKINSSLEKYLEERVW